MLHAAWCTLHVERCMLHAARRALHVARCMLRVVALSRSVAYRFVCSAVPDGQRSKQTNEQTNKQTNAQRPLRGGLAVVDVVLRDQRPPVDVQVPEPPVRIPARRAPRAPRAPHAYHTHHAHHAHHTHITRTTHITHMGCAGLGFEQDSANRFVERATVSLRTFGGGGGGGGGRCRLNY